MKLTSGSILTRCRVAAAPRQLTLVVRHKQTKMKFKIFIAALFILVPVLVWIGDVNNDQKHKIEIEQSIGLYNSPEEAAYSGSPIDTVEKNEKVKVKRIKYGKDYMAVKIEKSNGSVGWVVVGNGVKVLKPENA